MVHPLVAGLPDWASDGLTLGAVLAVLVAAAFAVGTRRFPDPDRGTTDRDAGEGRRRAEIRAYLRSIGEPFVEDHPLGDLTVPFYLPDRGVALTFDARDHFVLQRRGTQTVLLELEVPGSSLGGRLPFETPDVGVADPQEAAAFERLGLAPTADAAAVRAAYRERAKAAHPDRGGDRESFRRLREAYAVARDRTG